MEVAVGGQSSRLDSPLSSIRSSRPAQRLGDAEERAVHGIGRDIIARPEEHGPSDR
jgi:hypothetical protein